MLLGRRTQLGCFSNAGARVCVRERAWSGVVVVFVRQHRFMARSRSVADTSARCTAVVRNNQCDDAPRMRSV